MHRDEDQAQEMRAGREAGIPPRRCCAEAQARSRGCGALAATQERTLAVPALFCVIFGCRARLIGLPRCRCAAAPER